MKDNIIRNFKEKKEEQKLDSQVYLDEIEEALEKLEMPGKRKQNEKSENIINAPFRYRMDLDALDPLSPEDEELLKFLTEEPPADENVFQKNYRINRLNEFDNLVKELIEQKNKK